MLNNTQVFQPSMPYQFERILLVKANGGSVAIDALLDAATDLWVRTDTISTDGASQLVFGNLTVRITPSGGAVYDVF